MVQRHKQTMTEKYGRDNYFKGEEGKKAVQDACMKKYGVDHPMQVKEIKQNAINTYKLKTGYDNPSQNPEVKKKKEETSLKNFGVTHAMKLDKYKLIFAEMRGVLHVNDLNELFFRNNFVKNNRFLVDKCSEYFNIHNERILFYKKKFNIKEQNLYKTLKTQQLFFDHLNNLNIIYDYRVKYKNKKFRPDGYDPKTNTIYEFLGDYWHGNPEVFNLNEINPSCYKTFKQLNEETFKRFDEIRSLGYKIIYIWESDFIKNNKIKENWRSKMVEY